MKTSEKTIKIIEMIKAGEDVKTIAQECNTTAHNVYNIKSKYITNAGGAAVEQKPVKLPEMGFSYNTATDSITVHCNAENIQFDLYAMNGPELRACIEKLNAFVKALEV